MKAFNLKNSLQTLLARDTDGKMWRLHGVDIMNTRLEWRSNSTRSCYGETDLDGKVMFGECSDLYSAEVEEATQTFFVGKIHPGDAAYAINCDGPSFLHNIVYEINLIIEDGEIKATNFEKVRGK